MGSFMDQYFKDVLMGLVKLDNSKLTKLHGLSLRANYTDRATAACRRSQCRLLRIDGVEWSAKQIPTSVFLVPRPQPLFFLPSSSSIVLTRLSGPRSRPTTFL
jgi:hypothetical protein